MAKHIFLFAVVALVVLVQQNDAAIIEVTDMVDEYILNVTHLVKSGVRDIEQKSDSKIKSANNFLVSSIDSFAMWNERIKKIIEDSPKQKKQECNKTIENFSESFNKLYNSSKECIVAIKQVTKDDIDRIQKIEKNIEDGLAELKERNKQCKTRKDFMEITFCASKVLSYSEYKVAQKIHLLSMKIEELNSQLRSIVERVDSCILSSHISMLRKDFFTNNLLVQNCIGASK